MLTASKAVVLATGSAAAVPPIDGLRDIRVWDSRDVTAAKQIPARLLVLGGGVVGVEMAQAYRSLGATEVTEVTVVEMADRLLASEEPFVGEELAAAFDDLGIRVLTGTAQLVIDQRRRLVGAMFVGPGVGELLHAATIAIVGEVPLATLWHAVPAFPTLSEVWLRLLEADRELG